MSLTVIQPREPGAILPMSWVDWKRDGDEYVGGDYRIRLIEPYRWEVVRAGSHLFYDTRLSGALTRADHHYRDRLRIRDLITWGAVLVLSVLLAAGVEMAGERSGLWSIPLLAVALYGGLSAFVRMVAAATRSRFDPYRRRAPWESRMWWRK